VSDQVTEGDGRPRDVQWFADRFARIAANVGMAIRGKQDVVSLALVALFSEGHVLLEDVPGVGKTKLGQAIARSIGGRFGRVQFTPDLLPSDITGTDVYNQATGALEFRAGPVFCNVLLADEINRASPKTQSALLEVMEERGVTFGAATHPVAAPFTVLATSNPIEHEGTYRLPEAQLDRFMMRISIGYPSLAVESEILRAGLDEELTRPVDQVLVPGEFASMVAATRQVQLAPALVDYIATYCAETRNLPGVRLGASPRATLALGIAARTRAASQGRHYVTGDDVLELVEPVLAHRLLLSAAARGEGHTAASLLDQLARRLPLPDRAQL
jgi:MoxR-like ATPase